MILSLREDYLPDLEGLRPLIRSINQNRLRIVRMNGTQAYQAVVKPGAALLEEGVASRIVEFVSGAKGRKMKKLSASLPSSNPAFTVLDSSQRSMHWLLDMHTPRAIPTAGNSLSGIRSNPLQSDRAVLEKRFFTSTAIRKNQLLRLLRAQELWGLEHCPISCRFRVNLIYT